MAYTAFFCTTHTHTVLIEADGFCSLFYAVNIQCLLLRHAHRWWWWRCNSRHLDCISLSVPYNILYLVITDWTICYCGIIYLLHSSERTSFPADDTSLFEQQWTAWIAQCCRLQQQPISEYYCSGGSTDWSWWSVSLLNAYLNIFLGKMNSKYTLVEIATCGGTKSANVHAHLYKWFWFFLLCLCVFAVCRAFYGQSKRNVTLNCSRCVLTNV